MKILSNYYRRFNVDEFFALAVVTFAWIASLACEWFSALLVLSRTEGGGFEGLIQPFLLTLGAVISVVLWRKSRAGDQQLPGKQLDASQEWRQSSVNPGIALVGGKKPARQQLDWALNELTDQVESAQAEMLYILACLAYGDFSRHIRPEGGFSFSLKQLSVVTEALADTTAAITDLMNTAVEADFNKKNDVDGEYKFAANRAIQAMQTMLCDVGNVLDGVARDGSGLYVKVDGCGDPVKFQNKINLSLDALDVLNNIALALIADASSKGEHTQTIV